MARTKTAKGGKRPIEQYSHTDKKRVNNPPVGLVAPDTDQKETKHAYAYDPHLDPSLQWAGKAERTSFEVPDRLPSRSRAGRPAQHSRSRPQEKREKLRTAITLQL